MSQPNIAFGVANYGPMWAPAASSWLNVIAFMSSHPEYGKVRGAGITDRMYTHSAENQLIKDVMGDKTFTHVFFTESDMVLPPDTLPLLLEVDKPIVSGVYFLRNGGGQPCLYVKLEYNKQEPWPHTPVSVFPENKPFKLGRKGGCPGFGCVLFKREVFEKIPFPWFDLNQEHYGSDMYFYTKAFESDYEVWVQPKVMCGQIDYTMVSVDDYHKKLKEGTKTGYIIGANQDLDADRSGVG